MTTRPRPHDPRRLDVERLAREGAQLDGAWPLAGMQRVVDSCHPDAAPPAPQDVTWSARGELRRVGAEAQTWLELEVHTRVRLTCQRCLGPVDIALDVRRRFRFVDGEEAAAALDAEIDDDVLARTRALDLHELAEDELLLAMPIVPRHDVCPEPIRIAAPQAGADDATTSAGPFAALAALRRVRH